MTQPSLEEALSAAQLALPQALRALEQRQVNSHVRQAHVHLDMLLQAFDAARGAVGLITDSIDELSKHGDTARLLRLALQIRGGDDKNLTLLQTQIQSALENPPPTPELVSTVEALLVLLRAIDGNNKEARAALRNHYDLAMAAAMGELVLTDEPSLEYLPVLNSDSSDSMEDSGETAGEPSTAEDGASRNEEKLVANQLLTPPLEQSSRTPLAQVDLLAWRFKKRPASSEASTDQAGTSTTEKSTPTQQQVNGDRNTPVFSETFEDMVSAGPNHPKPDLKQDISFESQQDISVSEAPLTTQEVTSATDDVEEHLWGLVAQHELALAYHVACALNRPDEEQQLFHALVMADGVGNVMDEATLAFDMNADGFLLMDPQPSTRVLQITAALPAAVIGASNMAVTVLREASYDAHTPLLARDLARAFVKVNDALNTAAVLSALNELPEARDSVDRAERRRDLHAQLIEARRDWRNWTVHYQAATQVWRALWLPDGLVGRAFQQAIDTQAPVGAEWSDDDLDRLIDNVQLRYDSNADRIHSKARDKLMLYLRKVRGLLQDWNATCRQTSNDYRITHLSAFLDEWHDLGRRMERRTPEVDVALEAAMLALSRAFERVGKALHGDTAKGASPAELLRRGLLRMQLAPNDNGAAHAADVQSGKYEDRAKLALTTIKPWSTVVETYADEGDFRNAYAALDMLDENEGVTQRSVIDRRAHETRKGLLRAVKQTTDRLERAVYQGLLPDEIARDFEAQLAEIKGLLDDPRVIRAADVRRRLDIMEATFADHARERTDTLRARLDDLNPNDAARAVVERQLLQEDFHTAQEYLDLLEQDEPLPDDVEESLLTLLPTAFEKAEAKYMQGKQKTISDASQGLLKFLPHHQGLTKERQDTGTALLERWYNLHSPVTPAKLKGVLERLDFPVVQVEPDGRLDRLFKVRTMEVRDRRVIPAALFGSQASGQYRVYVTQSSRISVGQVFNQLTNIREPVIVLYNGALSLEERREAARLSRESARTVIFVDTLVMLLLVGEPDDRRPGFFRYTLPFTWFVPFTSVATFMPPEMFYGREEALDALIDPRGANYVFGGRQLGKSALLMQAVERGHSPERGTVVRRIDINSIGPGGRDVKDIWALMATELARDNIVSAYTTTASTFVKNVRDWLDKDSTRRIVLLLDEADGFLLQDAGEDGMGSYIQVKDLKTLMDDTQRRFKVVLTGLNNVVRTYSKNNSPLVHLGDPIEIGPMLEGPERQAAAQLLTEPFALLGYTFERMDLVYRILARTNYYPSLIQLYADALLRDLQKRDRDVPVIIRDDDVDLVYQSRALRDRIRERFLWTLGLDLRYEVVAYALANALDARDTTLGDGANLDQLYDWATSWLPQVFEVRTRTTREQFKPLLEEMIVLGVLRYASRPGEFYTFRNTNAQLLLGGSEQINQKLHSLQQQFTREGRLGQISRREVLLDKPARAAPLDVRQVSATIGYRHGVSIITSTIALGASRIPEFLHRVLNKDAVVTAQAHDLNAFRQELEAHRRERDGTPRLLLIPQTVPWNERWLEEADARLRGLKRERDVRRVVFIADPAQWDRIRHHAILRQPGIDVIHARPWSQFEVRSWLEQHGIVNSDALLDTIEQRTGNWPIYLDHTFQALLESPDGVDTTFAIADVANANTRLDEMGLRSIDKRILKAFVEGGATSDDPDTISILADEQTVTPDVVQTVLEMSETYAWLRRDGLALNVSPILVKLLHSS